VSCAQCCGGPSHAVDLVEPLAKCHGQILEGPPPTYIESVQGGPIEHQRRGQIGHFEAGINSGAQNGIYFIIEQKKLSGEKSLWVAKCCSHAKSTSYVAHVWMLRLNVKRLALTF
jgi:hypothetical protein